MSDPWTIQNSNKDSNTEVKVNGGETVQEKGDTSSTLTKRESSEDSGSSENRLEFEDNFAAPATCEEGETQAKSKEKPSGSNNSNEYQPLPDSATYLQGLERRLQKLKKDSKLVDALSEKRDDCLRTLVNENCSLENNNETFELDTPIGNVEIYRHLQPVQPVTIGETVHIVKYDQLEQQRQASEGEEVAADEPETPESR